MDARTNYKYSLYNSDGASYVSPWNYIDVVALNILRTQSVNNVHVVNINEVNNFPLISYNIYNTIDYWWLLGLVNGKKNTFDIPILTKLMYPSLQDINAYFKALNNLTSTDTSDVNGTVTL